MIAEAANEGQEITRKQVRRLTDEFTAATSPLLPEEIRQRTADNLLPPRAVAPLVKELAKLPEAQQNELRRVLQEEPELERVKDVTHTARWLTKAAEAGLAVRAFQQGQLDFEKALQEAQRLDALGLVADAMGQARRWKVPCCGCTPVGVGWGACRNGSGWRAAAAPPTCGNCSTPCSPSAAAHCGFRWGNWPAASGCGCNWWRREPTTWSHLPCPDGRGVAHRCVGYSPYLVMAKV